MPGAFNTIKAQLDMPTVALHYGVAIGHDDMAKCPFHKNGEELRPSLKLYPTYFKCFACGESGSVIDLTQKLHGLETALDAAKLLDNDFKLGLFENKSMPPAARKQPQKAVSKTEVARHIYEYRDTGGILLYRRERADYSDETKTFLPVQPNGTTNLKGVQRVP